MLAVDNIAPTKSRLKFYFRTPHTGFLSMQDLQSLNAALTGLETDFPEDAEMSCVPKQYAPGNNAFVDLATGYLYYFDIAPGATLPDIKFYITLQRYGRDDLSSANGIMAWMEAHGWGAYGDRYLSVLRFVAHYRWLDERKGLQKCVNCLFKKNGELGITSYIAAEAFNPAWLRQGPVAEVKPKVV
ncbi:hypothetical protein BBP40_005332 [Aspergillus hancockii]|nr:hypothetical protein BBP40_005332 [Aspergillus hancockii]